jgi:hypothetical protein
MRRGSFLATLAVAVSVIGASQARADVVVTGTYSVTKSCKLVGNGVPVTSPPSVRSLEITQTGDDLNMVFETLAMNGRVQSLESAPDAKGVASMVTCGIGPDLNDSGNYNYLGRLDFKVKDGAVSVKGTFYSAGYVGNFVQLCKFKGTRTSSVDPLIGGCPP